MFGAGLHQADEDRGRFLQAGDLHECVRGGVQDPGKGAEVPQEFLGQGLDVGPGEGISEDQLQEFVILERGCASLEKATPQALAVAVIMGFYGFRLHPECYSRNGEESIPLYTFLNNFLNNSSIF
jgi:hypothetical protein